MVDTSDEWITQRTGIRERRSHRQEAKAPATSPRLPAGTRCRMPASIPGRSTASSWPR
jgi:hypothetical protein